MLKFIIKHTKDFGLVDNLYSFMGHNQKKKEIGDIQHHQYHQKSQTIPDTNYNKHIRHIYENETIGPTWVCFLPWRTTFEEALKIGILPKKGKVIVYECPRGIVNPNPEIPKKMLLALVDDIKRLNLGRFNVLGFSVGTYVAFYVANNFNVKKLVSVVPGAKLGACMWKGCSTTVVREMAISLGINSHKDYDKVIKGTNPSQNIHSLPQDIEVHIATHDKIIPSKYGYKLLNKIQKKHHVNIVEYEGKGHVLTLLQYGMTHSY